MLRIGDLLSVHQTLDEMFFEHQRELLHFRFDKAMKALEVYSSTLHRHMRDEEDVLLPIYTDLALAPGAGAPKLFYDDHERMRGYVDLFREKTAKLSTQTDVDKALLTLLDREAFYVRLCGHHDKRETEFLYPILDEALSDDDKVQLMARIAVHGIAESRLGSGAA